MRGSRASVSASAGAQLALHADEAHARHRQQRLELRQRHRTVAVVDMGGAARPGQRDARRRQRFQARPPFRDARVGRAQIGNVRRNVGELGLAGERQARQRAMQIERRQRLAARDDRGDAIEAGEQRLSAPAAPPARPWRRRAPAAARSGRTCTVSPSPCSACSRMVLPASGVSPSQSGLRKSFARAHAGALPAPFVFGKAARIVAERQQRQRGVEMRVGVVRLQRQRPAVARERLLMTVERRERNAAVEPGVEMVRRGRKRAVVVRERLLLAAERAQRIAAIVERERMAGRDRQRRVVIGDRLLGLARARSARCRG